MKQTLLQMTQDILSSMSSDEVNSISDNAESLQVATIIRTKYNDIINRLGLPDHDQFIQLNPSLNPSSPVLMTLPSGISEIKWIKYFDSNTLDGNTATDFSHDLNIDITSSQNSDSNAPPGYLYVTILPNDEFIDMVQGFNPKNTNTATYSFYDASNNYPGTYTLYYKTNQQPVYCTVISNFYVLFDGYDNTQDSTLQSSKTMVCGRVIPPFQMVDTFIPDLSEDLFPLLFNEAKSLAWQELKQQQHPLAMREVERYWSIIQKTKAVVNRPSYFDELPGFGRKRGYYGYRGGFWGYPENKRGGLY